MYFLGHTSILSTRSVNRFVACIGSRKFNNRQQIAGVLSQFDPANTIIVSGGARGADSISATTAVDMGFKVILFLPYLRGSNKSINDYVIRAGGCIASLHSGGYRNNSDYFTRNDLIAETCHELFCFGQGRGSGYTFSKAKSLGKPAHKIL